MVNLASFSLSKDEQRRQVFMMMRAQLGKHRAANPAEFNRILVEARGDPIHIEDEEGRVVRYHYEVPNLEPPIKKCCQKPVISKIDENIMFTQEMQQFNERFYKNLDAT